MIEDNKNKIKTENKTNKNTVGNNIDIQNLTGKNTDGKNVEKLKIRRKETERTLCIADCMGIQLSISNCLCISQFYYCLWLYGHILMIYRQVSY